MLVTPAAGQPSRRAQAWLTFNVSQRMSSSKFLRTAFAVVASFAASTAVWACWAYYTPGDYFANGSSLFMPSLAVVAVIAAFLGWHARSKIVRGFLVFAGALALAYIVCVPDGWWVHAPPGKHQTFKKAANQALQHNAYDYVRPFNLGSPVRRG